MAEQRETNQYSLGSSQRETERLVTQGTLIEPRLRQLFDQAGIKPGMSVLDLGSGAGDVALLAREYVGAGGHVVGIDRDPISTARAKQRIEDAGLTNVTLIEADLMDPPALNEVFDAIVGRRVLCYLPAARDVIRAFMKYLRAGGVVAFAELDFEPGLPRLDPPSQLFDRWRERGIAAHAIAGMNLRMGSQLESLFVECGLENPVVNVSRPVMVRPGERNVARLLAGVNNQIATMRSLLPIMKEHGIATLEELERFEEEMVAIGREIEEEGKLPVGGPDYNVSATKPVGA